VWSVMDACSLEIDRTWGFLGREKEQSLREAVGTETADRWYAAFLRLKGLWQRQHSGFLISILLPQVLAAPDDYRALLEALMYWSHWRFPAEHRWLSPSTDRMLSAMTCLLRRRVPDAKDRDRLTRLLTELEARPRPLVPSSIGDGGERQRRIQAGVYATMLSSPYLTPVPVEIGGWPQPLSEFMTRLRNWVWMVDATEGHTHRIRRTGLEVGSSNASLPLAPTQRQSPEPVVRPLPLADGHNDKPRPYRLDGTNLIYQLREAEPIRLTPMEAKVIRLLIDAAEPGLNLSQEKKAEAAAKKGTKKGTERVPDSYWKHIRRVKGKLAGSDIDHIHTPGDGGKGPGGGMYAIRSTKAPASLVPTSGMS
jgi:hypothetical protein